MIIRDGTDEKIERMKYKLGLEGDVYLVGQNYIESLESHKRLIPTSTATTIEEAEQERLALMKAEEEERERQAKEAAEREAAEKEAEEKESDKEDSGEELPESHQA
jgi:hypothetical protein